MKFVTKCPCCDAKIGFEFELKRGVLLEYPPDDGGVLAPNLRRFNLTKMEGLMAELALAGMSNKQIADSLKTKEGHVRNVFSNRIYPKMGCRSIRGFFASALSPVEE